NQESNDMTHKHWTRGFVALVAVLALVAAGCSEKKTSTTATNTNSGVSTDAGGGAGAKIRITSQDFGEQKTLAQVYGQYLKANGYDVTIQRPTGTRTQIVQALKGGKVDLELDYQGSLATELDKTGKPSPSADKTYTRLTTALKGTGLQAATPAPAQDGNALVALKTWATKNGITKISDLKKIQDQVTLGGAPECATRPDCLKGYEGPLYGLKLKGTKVVAYGPALVEGLKANTIQVAQYQTSAPEITTGEIVVLKDDKGLQSAENVVPIFTSKVASAALVKDLDALSAQLTDADLAAWNKSTDIDKDEPVDVAKKWLQDKGLI
ncbi:MAG: glycine/betaine transporter substrate-binding protein, partial [Acidimicrobiales bacterium]|nr:glycine/betaine transporter substrate-binding protein [Acidimicrobiales bacterium]